MQFTPDQIAQMFGGFMPPAEHPFPEHIRNARTIAADGMVLLKNDDHALPISPQKLALFGAGADETVACGTGSGYVTAPMVSVRQGLENAGFTITSTSWLDRFLVESKRVNDADTTLSDLDRFFSGMKILIDEAEVTEEDLQLSSEAETAVYVIRRNAGENGDRDAVRGDYFLSDAEEANLRKVAAAFSKTVVVLNTTVIDANFLFEIPGIDAAVLMGLAGMEGGNALADVLTGKKNPSGHLTDTWARAYGDNPAAATFGKNGGNSLQQDYCEDIFVGYRYFDTFGIEPLFPFGYGLSYTAFSLVCTDFSADWHETRLTVAVSNTGDRSGRAVAQVYVSAPEGRLAKPYQELKGFAKTKELAPGETQTLTIRIPTESFASYDEEKAAFLMEPGHYLFRLGEHSRSTAPVAEIVLDKEAVLRQVRNEVKPDHELERLVPPARKAKPAFEVRRVLLSAEECPTVDGACPTREADRISRKRFEAVETAPDATLIDVREGRVSLDSFVKSLEPEVLFRLVAGAAFETPYEAKARLKTPVTPVNGPSSSGTTTALFTQSLGIPQLKMTDGPAGLHLGFCQTTCNPVGMLIAQTFDCEAARLYGEGIGKELAFYHQAVILGPGMNIHRDPLCGRAFEYFSEDPLLTGLMGAAATQGVQATPGVGVSIKHFCCNNQEQDRPITNATVSERALREIYWKGFEICVRQADPMTVMSSYNCVNGIHTSSHYELLTEVLRGEWGFQGLVMTDWGSQSTKPYDIHAGNDLIMGGYRSEFFAAAFYGKEPEFAQDGFVRSEDFPIYGGFMTDHVEFWNSFEPDANGPDQVSVTVAAGQSLNEKITGFIELGIAAVEEHADGSRTVTYRGTNRGKWLDIDELRACAARVLETIMKSVSYDLMIG
ncbi:MAG: glycoside hydrolase family 3 C-terminal domain-containing protein [Oscillospiraceae bacterium]|nr:glycoside hydrolase family 3 C-terminal domain-containing protein [Oscillospiraceae bacterium]